MNIRDMGSLGGDMFNRTRGVSERDRTENTDQTSGSVESGRTAPVQNDETMSRDVVSTTDVRQKVEKFARAVEAAGDEPRTDRVELAQQRAASGYYNSEEFLGSLALRIVNTGLKG